MLSRQDHLRIAREHGQYFTPEKVVSDILALSAPGRNASAVDPACGGGVILDHLVQRGVNTVHGFDVDPDMVTFSRKRVGNKAMVAQRDVLVNGLPQKYDYIVANPPFSPSRPDTAPHFSTGSVHPAAQFAEMGINHLTEHGLMAIIADRGLVTTASHRETRRQLTQMAHLERIVELPDSAFREDAGTDFSTFVLYFRRYHIGPTVFVSSMNEQVDSPDYQKLLAAGDWIPRSCAKEMGGCSTLGDFVDLVFERFEQENAHSPKVHPETRMLINREQVPQQVRRCVRGCLFMSRFAPGESPPRCAPITEQYHGAGTTAEYYIIRPKDERDLPWLWYVLNFQDGMRQYMNERARGLAHKRVLPDEFLEMPIVRPDEGQIQHAQRCFSEACELATRHKTFQRCLLDCAVSGLKGSVD